METFLYLAASLLNWKISSSEGSPRSSNDISLPIVQLSSGGNSSSSACGPSRNSSISLPSSSGCSSPQPIFNDGEVSNDPSNKLSELFRLVSEEKLKYIYYVSKHSFTKAIECLLDGPSFESLRTLVRSRITVPLKDSPRIRLELNDDEDDWVDAALSFYKHGRFVKDAGVRILIRGQPAVDTGGVRKQFFSVVFQRLADPTYTSACFEGPPNRLRPVHKASIFSSRQLAR